MHFADQAKDLAMYNLTKESHQAAETQAKDLYPMETTYASVHSRPAPVANSALLAMASGQSRFNYNDYMKGLNDKLSIVAPKTKQMVGTGFQEFLLKERQQYLTSVATHDYDNGGS